MGGFQDFRQWLLDPLCPGCGKVKHHGGGAWKARMLTSSSQETKKKEQQGQGLATIDSIPPETSFSSQALPPTVLLIPSGLFRFCTHQWIRVHYWLCLNPYELIISINTPQIHPELWFTNVLVTSQFKLVNKTNPHREEEKLGLRGAP